MKKVTSVQFVIAVLIAAFIAIPVAEAQDDLEPIETVPQLERAVQGRWVSDDEDGYPVIELGMFRAREPFVMLMTVQSGDSTKVAAGITSPHDQDSNSITFSSKMDELSKEYMCRFELTDRSLTCSFVGEDKTDFYVKQEKEE